MLKKNICSLNRHKFVLLNRKIKMKKRNIYALFLLILLTACSSTTSETGRTIVKIGETVIFEGDSYSAPSDIKTVLTPVEIPPTSLPQLEPTPTQFKSDHKIDVTLNETNYIDENTLVQHIFFAKDNVYPCNIKLILEKEDNSLIEYPPFSCEKILQTNGNTLNKYDITYHVPVKKTTYSPLGIVITSVEINVPHVTSYLLYQDDQIGIEHR